MKTAALLIAPVLLLCGSPSLRAGMLQPPTRAEGQTTFTRPAVTFAYADLYDRFCAEVTNTKIDPAAVNEVERRLAEFEDAWRREAPQLVSAVVALTGAPFEFSETKAALSLCNPGLLSFPLIIDVRRYLTTLDGEHAAPLHVFVGTVLHETLHRYVNDRKAALPGGTTPLLEKHRTEPAPVRNHIHLFAVLDGAYRRVGRQAHLEQLMAHEAKSKTAAVFARARAIVAAEGADRVICEISRDGCASPKR